MASKQAFVFHLGLEAADLAGASLAIVPGDPARVARVAARLTDSRHLASNREFTSHLGELDGTPVVVCSTGIGGPSVSIAVEELAQLGVRTFLRVGTTGSIQPDVPSGTIVITQAAVRLDGASFHFAPGEYPAASDFWCTKALVEAAEAVGADYRVGITASSDTFYPGQERYDTVAGSVTARFRGSLADWKALHVVNYEMESATLFTMCSANGWRAGCVAGVIANRAVEEIPTDEAAIAATEERAIDVVIEASRRLLAQP
ncbi:MAG: uridine phosphorylase [Acidimicrobiia bacterium]|nr:uridine phosphorylase [Acidimicrobiia bacterium]MDH5521491.1 uridine phosphorylase [Acidimicrobiia bacterium]